MVPLASGKSLKPKTIFHGSNLSDLRKTAAVNTTFPLKFYKEKIKYEWEICMSVYNSARCFKCSYRSEVNILSNLGNETIGEICITS